MKNLYNLLFLLISFFSFAQNENEPKTLEVVGLAKVAISPDVGILNINISHIDDVFSRSITGLNRKSEDLNNQLKRIGFEQTAIKTNNFNVNKNRIFSGNKTIDSGYIATQQIQLEFKNNKNNITRILNQFSRSNTEFVLDFNFKLSDSLKEDVQKQIIALATEDAFNKAKLISDAAETQLDRVYKINYGNNFNAGMKLYNNDQGLNEIVLRGGSYQSRGFTPSDIVYTDNILVIWNLK